MHIKLTKNLKRIINNNTEHKKMAFSACPNSLNFTRKYYDYNPSEI